MNKKTILLTLLAYFIAINIGYSQSEDPCEYDDCFEANNVEWEYDTQRMIPNGNCPDCWVDITFKFRSDEDNCPNSPVVEFVVTDLMISGGCFYPCDFFDPPSPIYEYDITETNALWAQAHKFLIFNQLIPGFERLPSPSTTVFESVKTARCFVFETLPNGDIQSTWCQDMITCCVQKLTVFKDVYGSIYRDIWDVLLEQGEPCDLENNPECVEDCASFGSDIYVPKIGVDDEGNFIDISYGIFSIEPNPASEGLMIKYNSSNSKNWDNAVVTIVNSEGVQTFKDNIVRNQFDYLLNVKPFAQGNYFLQITIDGNMVSGQKLIIQR